MRSLSWKRLGLDAKLKGARDCKWATGVKVEGRKSYAEMSPDIGRLAKRLHRYSVNGKRRSLREISQTLARLGHVASSGRPFDEVDCALQRIARPETPIRSGVGRE